VKDPYLNQLLTKNEKVVFETRQHWLVLTLQILPELLSAIVITTLVTILYLNQISGPALLWAYLLNLIPLASLLRDYLRWRFHTYIVTTRRVIQISGIFAKNVSDSSLEKVNDVNLQQSVWGRFFDFGTLEILTASELGMERFVRVAHPIQFKKALLEARD
jgi:uncharacterized membrane protein YdbT with pleckstrin-like domain